MCVLSECSGPEPGSNISKYCRNTNSETGIIYFIYNRGSRDNGEYSARMT